MEDIVNRFSDALKTACNKSFKIGKAFMKTNTKLCPGGQKT